MKEGVMSPYKSFLSAAKTYFNSVPFLKFLLSAYIYVFAAGGLFFVIGVFLPVTAFVLRDFLTCIGGIIAFGGLILTLFAEDDLTLVITSGSIGFLSFVAWIWKMISAGSFWGYSVGGVFFFEPLIYFLIFGGIATLTFIKSEKFKQMREESAARAQATAGVPCPRCGAVIPNTAGFCPACGLPRPVQPQQPPVQPQQPPVQPMQPPVQPMQPPVQPMQPPVQPMQPPVQPAQPPVPPVQPPVPPVQPMQPPVQPVQPPVQPPVPPVQPEPEPSVQSEQPKCVGCGADIVPGAVFCGKCGTKQ